MNGKDTSAELRSLVQRLDPICKGLITNAAEIAFSNGHAVLDVEHFLMAIVEEKLLEQRLSLAGLCLRDVHLQLLLAMKMMPSSHGLPPAITERLLGLMRDAWRLCSINDGQDFIHIDYILSSLFSDQHLLASLLEYTPGLESFSLKRFLDEKDSDDVTIDQELKGSELSRYTIDLTAFARAGKIDPVIGREAEIDQLIEILLRRRQNNPILTGEAGVGKTAIVEGLAQRIALGLVPDALRCVSIRSLDMGLLKSGTCVRGELESRLKRIIVEISTSSQPVILFVDEAHTLVGGVQGGGEQNDLANLIKPELARGSLRTIAATTWSEYKRYFEKDAALSRRFQVVRADEPSTEDTISILSGLLPILSRHHGVYIVQEALEAAVDLSSRYIHGRQQPDKAISVLDTACARAVARSSGPAARLVMLQQRRAILNDQLLASERELNWGKISPASLERTRQALSEIEASLVEMKDAEEFPVLPLDSDAPPVMVGKDDVASVIADWSGVPSYRMLVDRSQSMLSLKDDLSKRVAGQHRAIEVIAKRMSAYGAGMVDANKPIGVFLLVGPSGVGKTETAHALADAFFGGEASMTVVNMSEYQEAHTVSKLKGAPPGYIGFGQGGILTEAIRRRSYGVLLLDEIEKAHQDVIDLFLQVFDKGFMEDSEGVRVDFKNTLIILTSNACSELFDPTWAIPGVDVSAFEARLAESLLSYFRAAFLGRVQVVPYYPLGKSEVASIVEQKLLAVQERFAINYRSKLSVAEDFVSRVVERTMSSVIGARSIDQFIAENVLSALSLFVLQSIGSGRAIPDLRLKFTEEGGVLVEDWELKEI